MESEIVVSEEGSKRHLPEDIWPGILSRLPAKSLLRFRCVSKSWLSMINDPDFCRLHLKNFKNNRDEPHLLVVEGKQRNCVLRCNGTFKANTEATLPNPTLEVGDWYIESCIDGLVVLRTIKISEPNELRIGNPSIGKFHDIPPLPEIEGYTNMLFNEEEIGLGYDPLVKDYKYVKIISIKACKTMPPVVAIYTVGARSWKIVPFQFQGRYDWFRRVHGGTGLTTVYFRGSLYFMAIKRDRIAMEMFSVDVSREVFSCTSLPDRRGHTRFLTGLLALVDDGSTLAVFDFNIGAMWVLDSSGEPRSWCQRYSFCVPDLHFLYLKKNGDVLFWWEKSTSAFRLAAGEKFEQWCGMVSSYNLETKKEEMPLPEEGFVGDCAYHIRSVCGYIESLVMLN